MSSFASNAALHAESSEDAPADYSSLRRENVRISSRGLGWGPLNFERRENPPGSRTLPNGSSQHLIFVGLGSGRVVRESAGEQVECELAPGSVALVPSHTPVGWSWRRADQLFSLDPGPGLSRSGSTGRVWSGAGAITSWCSPSARTTP